MKIRWIRLPYSFRFGVKNDNSISKFPRLLQVPLFLKSPFSRKLAVGKAIRKSSFIKTDH